jgi:hypothetical protein
VGFDKAVERGGTKALIENRSARSAAVASQPCPGAGSPWPSRLTRRTVPVERVRLGKETVTEDHEVSETLRKEQIDDPDTNGTTRP